MGFSIVSMSRTISPHCAARIRPTTTTPDFSSGFSTIVSPSLGNEPIGHVQLLVDQEGKFCGLFDTDRAKLPSSSPVHGERKSYIHLFGVIPQVEWFQAERGYFDRLWLLGCRDCDYFNS